MGLVTPMSKPDAIAARSTKSSNAMIWKRRKQALIGPESSTVEGAAIDPWTVGSINVREPVILKIVILRIVLGRLTRSHIVPVERRRCLVSRRFPEPAAQILFPTAKSFVERDWLADTIVDKSAMLVIVFHAFGPFR